jgi:predicted nucleotide-binding protein
LNWAILWVSFDEIEYAVYTPAKNIELPSDIIGIAYHKFENKVNECFREIYIELKNAGYELKL